MLLDLLYRVDDIQCVLFVAQQSGVEQPYGIRGSVYGDRVFAF